MVDESEIVVYSSKKCKINYKDSNNGIIIIKSKISIMKLSNKLNISYKVKFWGKQEDINKFYRTAKVFAFTSESEGLPNVLLEAMAAGLACISFDCVAGPRDLIIDSENGYLVNMYDCEGYISKLNTLIKNSELREKFSNNAQKQIEQYNINIIGEKFFNFLLS